ncbi:adenine phosphoribosyltransferase [Rhodococcus spongiicola]|uniref:Adenine phosphoribosyltransferase n=1 Tax=Rhodococcus spongiicola TaxID=2487352 RepID=A0A3S3AAF0_9NOCA|nr:adenine phosphoribosyltransferase [Rhodococcus spongiicola]RVW03457.1 adenine phosphoribosyltransferase [Rhodococcus spongiicola]
MDAPEDANPTRGDALEQAEGAVSRLTRWCDDFPTPGVRFADLTPVFADGPGFRAVIEGLAAVGVGAEIVAGVDARGFLLGGGVAMELGCGVLAVRKAGKLPPPVHSQSYLLEYGTGTLEIPSDAPDLRGRRVFVIDDVLATGGTLLAAAELLTRAGAEVVGVAVVLEIEELGGRARLDRYPVTSLIRV